MARRRKFIRSGGGTIVLLVILIVMCIIGGMLLFLAIGDAEPTDVDDTVLEPVAGVAATSVNLFANLLPILIWLGVAGVLIVAIVFVYRGIKLRRR